MGVVLTLGVLSVFHGWALRDTFIGWGRPGGWSTGVVEAEFLVPLGVKLAPLGVSLLAGGLCGWGGLQIGRAHV